MKQYKRLTIKEVKKALKYKAENGLLEETREDALDRLESLEYLTAWLKSEEKHYKGTDAHYGVSFKEYLGIEEEKPMSFAEFLVYAGEEVD